MECAFCGSWNLKLDSKDHGDRPHEVEIDMLPNEKIIICGECVEDQVLERYGWVDRSGRFYSCLQGGHEKLANVLGCSESGLEIKGWIKVILDDWLYSTAWGFRLSAEQANFLTKFGYDIKDFY